MAKLKEWQVLDIFNYQGDKKDLIAKHGVKRGTINEIKLGLRWGSITGKHHPKSKKRLKDLNKNT